MANHGAENSIISIIVSLTCSPQASGYPNWKPLDNGPPSKETFWVSLEQPTRRPSDLGNGQQDWLGSQHRPFCIIGIDRIRHTARKA